MKPIQTFALLAVGMAVCHGGWTALADPASPSPAASPVEAPPLWLGSPGVDPVKASAAARERAEADKLWAIENDLQAYERTGKKDPRWDADARLAIRLASSNGPFDLRELSAHRAEQKAACERALAAGCDDPEVVYLSLRAGCYPPNTSKADLARLYTKAEQGMFASGYSPLRKFFAAARALEADLACRRSTGGETGPAYKGTEEAAAGWAEGTDVQRACEDGLTTLRETLQDPATPPGIWYQVASDFLENASTDPISRAAVLVPLAKRFDEHTLKGPPSYNAKLLEGEFWIVYAWDVRTIVSTKDVPPDRIQKFHDRIVKAGKALEDAWKLNSTGGVDAAAAMITVTLDLWQNDRRTVIDQWFRRAMDVFPYNYDAGRFMLNSLSPRWGDNPPAAYLDFGRKALATRSWVTRFPLLLRDAHLALSKQSADPVDYWKQPEVWADLHKVYQGYLAYNPQDRYERTWYAVLAFRAEDWPAASEQMKILGDKPDEGALRKLETSLPEYLDNQREVNEHLKESTAKTS